MLLHKPPAELLLQILPSPNSLSDLRALATTSRRVYTIFRRDQATLIYHVLAKELGPQHTATRARIRRSRARPPLDHVLRLARTYLDVCFVTDLYFTCAFNLFASDCRRLLLLRGELAEPAGTPKPDGAVARVACALPPADGVAPLGRMRRAGARSGRS
ncbi:hypothetical protein VTI74DRAFT_9106 [Chaetomium olivicolor]